MGRPAREKNAGLLDTELDALPPELRWREWMIRVEAVIFAAPEPVTRDMLARLVGRGCSIDLLIEDIANELAARPYEIVAVAGGWQFRTRPRQAEVLKAAFGGATTGADITEGEMIVLASIAYHQPVTRGALSDRRQTHLRIAKAFATLTQHLVSRDTKIVDSNDRMPTRH